MSRFLSQAISTLTVVGYVLVITWGPLWHDHQHCHAHNPAGCCSEAAVEHSHSHPHACSHHHAHANGGAHSPNNAEALSDSPSAPCHSPLHDEDCPVCQVLAHPPLAAPEVAVVEVSASVRSFVSPSARFAERLTPVVYDSRGPPLV